MKVDTTFLRSKVARRIFMLFVFCALLPIAALAIISFGYVTEQLNEQSRKRLHQGSKAVAMSIYERLLFLEAQMKTVASNIHAGGGIPTKTPFDEFGEELKRQFRGMILVSDSGGPLPLFGRIQNPLELTPAEKQHLSSGGFVLSSQSSPDLPSRIFMSRVLDPQRPSQRILLGEINETYLWGTGGGSLLPPTTDLCVLDHSNNVLFCSLPGPTSFPEQIEVRMTRSASGRFEWRRGEKEFLASYWSLPLKYKFYTPRWTVVLSESKAGVLAPMASFKKNFPLVILLSLWVVLFLSIIQIRRSLVPLEKLQAGTRRIAMRDFASRVTVKSADEFEELAASFNTMASRLGSQFHTLATMAEIDRAILSLLDTEKIVETVLTRMRNVFPCDRVGVTLLNSNGTDTARTYLRDGNPEGETLVEDVELTPEELQTLCDNPERVFTVNDIPHSLMPLARHGIKSWLVLPLFFARQLSGAITLGYLDPPVHSQEDLLQARQLADQVAVALQNSHLYEQIKKQAVELEIANKGKDEFLGVMSHELRTPLCAVFGYTDMIKDRALGELTPGQEKALEKITNHSQDLLSMINSILQATSIESGRAKVNFHEVNLSHFLDGLRTTYAVPVGKELTLNWDYPSDLPSVKTNSERLKHVLQNLINNAIKFTEKGYVTISARDFPETRVTELEVADTGIGIPEESLPHIFEMFRQLDGSDTRSYGGVGLGLYIVEKMTELLGGKVEVESELGKGSTFTVTIPYE